MIAVFATPLNWLTTVLHPPALPLERPALNVLAAAPARLPPWMAQDPVAQKYLALLGELPWDRFPERPARRPGGGP